MIHNNKYYPYNATKQPTVCDNCSKVVVDFESPKIYSEQRSGLLCYPCWFRYFAQNKVTKMMRSW